MKKFIQVPERVGQDVFISVDHIVGVMKVRLAGNMNVPERVYTRIFTSGYDCDNDGLSFDTDLQVEEVMHRIDNA